MRKLVILSKIFLNRIKIAWYSINLVFPITFITKLPGILILGIIYTLLFLLRLVAMEDLLSIFHGIKSNRLTFEQIETLKKWHTYSTHLAWWFWILFLVSIIY